MTFEESIIGSSAPEEILQSLALLEVDYVGFDNHVHSGQLLVSREVARDVEAIFVVLLEHKFPIEKMVPIAKYGWDDIESMNENNTSAFNYRMIAGTANLSNHSFGRAIDINPKTNPYIGNNGITSPPGLRYNHSARGAIVDGDIIVQTFLKYGWEWGGHWQSARGYVDYQHFQKTVGESS